MSVSDLSFLLVSEIMQCVSGGVASQQNYKADSIESVDRLGFPLTALEEP